MLCNLPCGDVCHDGINYVQDSKIEKLFTFKMSEKNSMSESNRDIHCVSKVLVDHVWGGVERDMGLEGYLANFFVRRGI